MVGSIKWDLTMQRSNNFVSYSKKALSLVAGGVMSVASLATRHCSPYSLAIGCKGLSKGEHQGHAIGMQKV